MIDSAEGLKLETSVSKSQTVVILPTWPLVDNLFWYSFSKLRPKCNYVYPSQ